MNSDQDEKLRALLREALPPVAPVNLPRDLWPQVLRRLAADRVRVPWFDWALAAILAALFVLFPEVIPVLVYHL